MVNIFACHLEETALSEVVDPIREHTLDLCVHDKDNILDHLQEYGSTLILRIKLEKLFINKSEVLHEL